MAHDGAVLERQSVGSIPSPFSKTTIGAAPKAFMKAEGDEGADEISGIRGDLRDLASQLEERAKEVKKSGDKAAALREAYEKLARAFGKLARALYRTARSFTDIARTIRDVIKVMDKARKVIANVKADEAALTATLDELTEQAANLHKAPA